VGALYITYAFFFWAPIVSILIYNTALLAMAITVALLVVLGAPTRVREHAIGAVFDGALRV
jgi:hypothetical protein